MALPRKGADAALLAKITRRNHAILIGLALRGQRR
jgi:hypothetical protein